MFKSGYKMIDLQDKPLSGTGVVIKGIYDAIESNYRKAIMLTGLVVTMDDSAVEFPSVFTFPVVVDGNFVLTIPMPSTTAETLNTFYQLEITVTDDDEVTAAVVSNAEYAPPES